MKRALVLSLICVLGLTFAGMAATLSGEWDTDVVIDPAGVTIELDSTITVVYTVGSWAFTSVTTLDEAGWVDQTFAASGVLGAFSASSALDLDVSGAFDSWTTSADVSIAGVNLGGTFLLATPDFGDEVGGATGLENDAALIITAGGTAGEVDIDIEVMFGDIYLFTGGTIAANRGYVGPGDGCDLDWNGVTINVGFPFCCAEIDLALEFDCTGFVSATFTTGGISIPTFPWLLLDVEIVFDLDAGKTFTFIPSVDLGDIACFTLDVSVDAGPATMGPLVVGDISITGIGLSVDCFGVTFSGYTDFDIAEGDYFEWYSIETTDDACCGPLPFAFDLTFYFLEGSNNLFDVSFIEANVEVPMGENFLFNMGLSVDLEGAGFTEWIVGFQVTW